VEDDILLTAATGRPGELNFLDTPVDTSSSSVRHPAVKPTFAGVGTGHDRVSRQQLAAREAAATGQRPYSTTGGAIPTVVIYYNQFPNLVHYTLNIKAVRSYETLIVTN
jgi:hypothetical protein